MAEYSFTRETKGFSVSQDGGYKKFFNGYTSNCYPTTDGTDGGVYVTIDNTPVTRYDINLDTDTVEVDGDPFSGTSEELAELLNNTILFKEADGGGGTVSVDPTPVNGSENAISSNWAYGANQDINSNQSDISDLQQEVNNLVQSQLPLGEVFTDDFARASLGTSYTKTGSSATFSPDGSKLIVSGGIGTVTEYITRNDYVTNAEEFTIKLKFKATTLGSGIFIRIQSFSNGVNQQYNVINFNSSTGFLTLYNNSTSAGPASLVGLSNSANDDFTLFVNVVRNVFTFVVINEITKLSTTLSYTYPLIYTGSPSNIPNQNKFAIGTQGGAYQVTEFTGTINTAKNSSYGFAGDSLASGFYGGSTDDRFANIIGNIDRTRKSIVYARQGIISQDLVDCISEMIALNVNYWFLMIGYNDVSQSVPTATTIANLTTIKNGLEGAGSTVVFLSIPTRTTLNTAIITAFAATNQYIDINTSITQSGGGNYQTIYNSGDNVHFNRAANILIARIIIANSPVIFPSNLPATLGDGKMSTSGDALNAPLNFGTRDNNNVKLLVNNTVRMVYQTDGWMVFGEDGSAFNNFDFRAGVGFPINTVSATSSTSSAQFTIKVDASGGARTINLSSAANTRRIYVIKKIDSSGNAVTIQESGKTIDGAATKSLTVQYESIILQADGTEWSVIGKYNP